MLKAKSRERLDKKGRALSPFDFDDKSKALLQGSLSSAAEAEGEWIEVELTADTGACDAVIHKMMCPGIPIVASQQPILGLAYEVANGASIPNLGEQWCVIWTEGASKVGLWPIFLQFVNDNTWLSPRFESEITCACIAPKDCVQIGHILRPHNPPETAYKEPESCARTARNVRTK